MTVMVWPPTGVPSTSGPGALHAVMAAPRSTLIRSAPAMRKRMWNLRRQPGMKRNRKPARSGMPVFQEGAEVAAISLGAVVWIVSVDLPLPPVTVAGVKAQVVCAGRAAHEKETGSVKPVPGVTLML